MTLRTFVIGGIISAALALQPGCVTLGVALWKDARDEERNQERIAAIQDQNMATRREIHQLHRALWEAKHPNEPVPTYLQRAPEPLYGVKSILFGDWNDQNRDHIPSTTEIIPRESIGWKSSGVYSFTQLPPGGGEVLVTIYRGDRKISTQSLKARGDNAIWYHPINPFLLPSGEYRAQVTLNGQGKSVPFKVEK